jgi:2,4-dienoyl-CoA reductase-like NADH-dependent reductase (Old Yellow Enzyme family)
VQGAVIAALVTTLSFFLIRPAPGDPLATLREYPTISAATVADLRARFGGPVMLNSGFGSVTELADVEAIIDEDLGDLVAVGREFLANPDLAERWRTGAALNEPNQQTFYGGGAEGYTDYPALDDEALDD